MSFINYATNEDVCPVCGTAFARTSEWVYKRTPFYFCSYHCVRAHDKIKAEKKKKELVSEIKRLNEQLKLCRMDFTKRRALTDALRDKQYELEVLINEWS